MIISRAQVDQVLRTYLRSAAENRTQRTTRDFGTSGDAVAISADASRIAELVNRAKEFPEVRAERVSELRESIRSGRYEVSPQDVADKWVQRLLADAAVLEGGDERG